MPEVDAETGNYFVRQSDDLFQSVNDRVRTPLGEREILSGYGFPADWPTLERDALTQAIGRALTGDALVDRFGVSYDEGHILVEVESVARLTW